MRRSVVARSRAPMLPAKRFRRRPLWRRATVSKQALLCASTLKLDHCTSVILLSAFAQRGARRRRPGSRTCEQACRLGCRHSATCIPLARGTLHIAAQIGSRAQEPLRRGLRSDRVHAPGAGHVAHDGPAAPLRPAPLRRRPRAGRQGVRARAPPPRPPPTRPRPQARRTAGRQGRAERSQHRQACGAASAAGAPRCGSFGCVLYCCVPRSCQGMIRSACMQCVLCVLVRTADGADPCRRHRRVCSGRARR